MVHYQYFVSPETPETNERLNQITGVQLYDESANLYSLDLTALKKLFKIKFSLQGTGGRASKQVIVFFVHRRLGNDGIMRKLAPSEIENLLREVLKLKPEYLQRAKLLKFK